MITSEAIVRESTRIRWQRVDFGADSFLVASYSATDNWRSHPSIASSDSASSASTPKPEAEKETENEHP